MELKEVCLQSGQYAVTMNGSMNGIYISRSSLDVAFDDCGQQVAPLTGRLTGDIDSV